MRCNTLIGKCYFCSFSMCKIIFFILCILMEASAEINKDGVKNFQKNSKDKIALLTLVESCTHKIFLNAPDNFEIGIGAFKKDGTFVPTTFRWDEIEHFYKSQPDKKIVALIINPSPLDIKNDHINTMVKKLEDIGYVRVVVVQNSGSGYHLISDTKK